MKVNILGTEYAIHKRTAEQDELLEKCDAYCDKTSKEIVISLWDKEDCELHNPEWYRKKLIRHEVVHAFLFESGFHECSAWKTKDAHNEQFVDWIAVQFPKILKVFQELDVL